MDKLEAELKLKNRIVQWAPLVAQCNQSGMTVRNWCNSHQIAYSTYCKYQKLVREAAIEVGEVNRLIPVKITEEKTKTVQITVNGYSLSFDESISDAILNRIIRCCHD